MENLAVIRIYAWDRLRSGFIKTFREEYGPVDVSAYRVRSRRRVVRRPLAQAAA
jgi:hypothetical protein